MFRTNAFMPLLTLSRYFRKVALIWRMQGHRGLVRAIYRKVRAKQDHLCPEIALLPAPDVSANLRFPSFPIVAVSVIVEAHAPLDTTHRCLSALLRHSTLHPYEVIVGTSQPTPGPSGLASEWHNVRIIDTSHVTDPCSFANEAASAARGDYLVFLSNTVQVQTGWLDAVVETFVLAPDAGAVGCRLMRSDGRLLEAGGVVWRDGHHAPCGYLDDPHRPEYSYLRPVDYCSLEAFAVRTILFHELRGFARQWGCSSFRGSTWRFASGRPVARSTTSQTPWSCVLAMTLRPLGLIASPVLGPKPCASGSRRNGARRYARMRPQ